MNKAEYMRELERLLQNIPENERVEALTYYEEYFNDAGEENEQQVITELGYPAKVAENIKEGLRGSMGYQNTGTGYQNTGYQHIGTQNVYTGTTTGDNVSKSDMPVWAIILIVLGCIIASPLILGAAGTVLGMLASVFFGLLGIIIGFGAAGIGVIVGGVCCLMIGFPALFVNGWAGMVLLGAGLLLLALGILFIMLTVWLCGWALPTFIKWVVKMCKKLFQKKENVVA